MSSVPRPQHRPQNLVSWSQHCTSIGYCIGRNEILWGVTKHRTSGPQSQIQAPSFQPTVLSMVALMLLCCVCLSSSLVSTECIVAKRRVLQQKLLLTAYRKSYEKSIGTKMNDLEHCQRSYQGHVNHCVIFDVEYLGNRQRQRLGSKEPPIEMAYGYQNHLSDDVT